MFSDQRCKEWALNSVAFYSDTGEVVYETEAPDTITSWIASAFAVNTRSGLGIAPTTSKVNGVYVLAKN